MSNVIEFRTHLRVLAKSERLGALTYSHVRAILNTLSTSELLRISVRMAKGDGNG